MTPNMLRQLWSLIESSQSRLLLDLDDGKLVNWLMTQMKARNNSSSHSPQDTSALEKYIQEHLLLIRDIADDSWNEQSSNIIASY